MTTAAVAVEQAVVFTCEGEALIGVLHPPPSGAPAAAVETGVVVVVGGPQYRAGSHRQFVQLARAVAAAGHPVLRFDVRGMGDSGGAQRGFEQLSPDIAAAIGALLRHAPGVRRVVLWGLCDGASAALLYLNGAADPRVGGLCLVNPWVRSPAGLARTRVKHYYVQRLLEPAFWRKLLRGGVGAGAVDGLLANLKAARRAAEPAAAAGFEAPFQQRMADAWHAFGGSMLLVLSGRDQTASEFDEAARHDSAWRGALRKRGLRCERLEQADHTFSDARDQQLLQRATVQWLASAR